MRSTKMTKPKFKGFWSGKIEARADLGVAKLHLRRVFGSTACRSRALWTLSGGWEGGWVKGSQRNSRVDFFLNFPAAKIMKIAKQSTHLSVRPKRAPSNFSTFFLQENVGFGWPGLRRAPGPGALVLEPKLVGFWSWSPRSRDPWSQSPRSRDPGPRAQGPRTLVQEPKVPGSLALEPKVPRPLIVEKMPSKIFKGKNFPR